MAAAPIDCKAMVAWGVDDIKVETVTVAPPKAGEVLAAPPAVLPGLLPGLLLRPPLLAFALAPAGRGSCYC